MMKLHAGDYFFFFDDETHPTAAWILGRITKVTTKRILFDGIIWTEEGFGMRVAGKGSWMHSESFMAKACQKVGTSYDKQAVIKRILK